MSLVLIAAVLFWSDSANGSRAQGDDSGQRWIGTWATAAQPARPAGLQTFKNQSLRLIVHTSAGGRKVRIRISNTYGDQPLLIGSAHLAHRSAAADIDPATDRTLAFGGRPSITVPARSMAVSDSIDLNVPPLSDLAVSLFLPEAAPATTSHSLALQTSYVSEPGDSTASAKFPVARTITSWPFLAGVDVTASPGAAAIVAFGSSTTDGDGSTRDANRRWPDVLAERLQKSSGRGAALGVLNQGIIGNRLLFDSPVGADNPFGPALGQAGVTRFDRDVLEQVGVAYVFMALGVNDILFPEFPFTPRRETINARDIISGYRRLIARAHKKGVQVFGTTIPPFEDATFDAAGLKLSFYTRQRDTVRQSVNDWIRTSRAFDAVVDFDEVLRDPARPARLLPAYAADDHLHVNDAGNVAQGNVIPLALFDSRR